MVCLNGLYNSRFVLTRLVFRDGRAIEQSTRNQTTTMALPTSSGNHTNPFSTTEMMHPPVNNPFDVTAQAWMWDDMLLLQDPT